MPIIRNERTEDYRIVEELTKIAFWNLNIPGCDEHYLAHIMRSHSDFISELDLVIEENNCIIGNVMYVKSKLIDEKGNEKKILTFGPLSISPEYQRHGYGKQLLEYSFHKAVKLGFDTIVIFGNPENYVSRGFKNCKKYNVGIDIDVFPVPLLVKELKEGVLQGKSWIFKESSAYEFGKKEAEKFDKTFDTLNKEYKASQELFYIYSNSKIN